MRHYSMIALNVDQSIDFVIYFTFISSIYRCSVIRLDKIDNPSELYLTA